MKSSYYIYLFNIILAIAIIITLCNTKQSTSDTAKPGTPNEVQEMPEEEQSYIYDIDKYRIWKDLNTIPPHEAGKLLCLKNNSEVIPFFQVGLDYSLLSKTKNRIFCYLHFFEKGILYCIIRDPLPASISYDNEELLFFRSDLVHFAEWNNHEEAISFIEQLDDTHFLLLSADSDIPITTIWKPLKDILSLFPLNRRSGVYLRYVPVCSIADFSENKLNFAEISPTHNILFEQMIVKAKDSTLTSDDAETFRRTMTVNKLEIITLLLNKGGYFYDAAFTPRKAHIHLSP